MKKALKDYEKINKFVTDEAQKTTERLVKTVLKYPESQRWYLLSRIINTVFNSHYHFSVIAAEREMSKRQIK